MIGPFEVSGEQIVHLETRFTAAVNKLLRAEAAAAGIAQSSLILTNAENTPDGGVDATVCSAPAGSDWIPEGDSVWQFKRSNVMPKACGEEFE
ncbi:MAG: hypothetical protein AAF531_10960, partial [Actinomycetota bacterium]